MPEAFKEKFNLELILHMSRALKSVNQNFNSQKFIALASDNLTSLELKARSAQITEALSQTLPHNFDDACSDLLVTLAPMQSPNLCSETSEHLIQGWAIMPMADYIAEHGIEQVNLNLAFDALMEMTKRFTSEFAIRPFLLKRTEESLDLLKQNLLDESHHVRRLISEGTRPRLPWGIQLSNFIKDPKPVLPLLEALKDDESEYVRRSVANHLNDISKDNPDLFISILQKWLIDAPDKRVKLLKHASRTLIKRGEPEVLALLGFLPANLSQQILRLQSDDVKLHQSLELSLSLKSSATTSQKLLIDYVIYHQKANGTLSPKVFKWKSIELQAKQSLLITKKHSFRPVTTREYYEGEHAIAVMINGITSESIKFNLSYA